MWELDYKESWALKNWCFSTVVLEKTIESHLDCKEIQPVNPKGNQPQIFIRRTDAEAEAPVLWPPDAKSCWKRPLCWESWKAKGERGSRGWDGRNSMEMNLSKLEMVTDREAWCAVVHEVSDCRARLGDWTTAAVLFDLRVCCTIFHSDRTILFSQQHCTWVPVSSHPQHRSHHNQCSVVSHCNFDLHLFNN